MASLAAVSLSPSHHPASVAGRSRESLRLSLGTVGRATRSRASARIQSSAVNGSKEEPILKKAVQDEGASDPGVRAALSLLKFYKREISPLLPSSCRYVPTCSEYSMEAYKRYGVTKGTILTAWRLCRCGSGFDPPRWFGEEKPSEQ